MSLHVTLLDATTTPLPAGLRLVLLGDGAVLARGTVDDKGCVTFAANLAGVRHTAVRLANEPGSAGAPGWSQPASGNQSPAGIEHSTCR